MKSQIQNDQQANQQHTLAKKTTTPQKKNQQQRAYLGEDKTTHNSASTPPDVKAGAKGVIPAKQKVIQRLASKNDTSVIELEQFVEAADTAEVTYTRYPIKEDFRRKIKDKGYTIDFPKGALVRVIDNTKSDKVKIRVKRYRRYYIGYVSRDLIDQGSPKKFSPEAELSEDFNQKGDGWVDVNKLGLAYKDEGTYLRDKPLPESKDNSSKKIGYLNQNDRLIVLRQNPQTGWSFVSTPNGKLGYTVSSNVWTNLPEPQAQIKKVRAGEGALEIAQNYYRENMDRWGTDNRFLVNALSQVNKLYNPNSGKSPGIYKNSEKDSWKEAKTKEGHYMWLPSVTYLDAYKGSVGSGSYTYEAYKKVAGVLGGAYEAVAYHLGFVGGVVHGAVYNIYEKLADIGQSVVGIFQAFWKLITGELWKDLKQMGEAIYKIIQDPKQLKTFMEELAQGLFGAILDKIKKLTDKNPWVAGHAAGYLTGYVAAEVLLAVFTGGAALLARLAKLGKLGVILGKVIGKATKLAERVPDPFNRRKKRRNRDRNDEKDENKLVQKQKALVMAKIITEGHDKADTPLPALMTSLQAVKKKYPVVKGFYSKPKSKGHYEIWMRASDLEVDDDYTPNDNKRPSEPSYKIGESDGGPGTWQREAITGKSADMDFQQKVTGAPKGVEYPVSGPNPAGKVKFDGYDPARNVLLDAKRFDDFPVVTRKGRVIGGNKIVEEALRQKNSNRGGRAIEWHVSSKEKADMVSSVLKNAGIEEIKIVFPPVFLGN